MYFIHRINLNAKLVENKIAIVLTKKKTLKILKLKCPTISTTFFFCNHAPQKVHKLTSKTINKI